MHMVLDVIQQRQRQTQFVCECIVTMSWGVQCTLLELQCCRSGLLWIGPSQPRDTTGGLGQCLVALLGKLLSDHAGQQLQVWGAAGSCLPLGCICMCEVQLRRQRCICILMGVCGLHVDHVCTSMWGEPVLSPFTCRIALWLTLVLM